jgi:hypothetical protein
MPRAQQICIHELIGAEGQSLRVYLEALEGNMVLSSAQDAVIVPTAVLRKVFNRYAKPLDVSSIKLDVDTVYIENTTGLRVHYFRHLATYDVIARDYLAFESADSEPRAELATGIAAALMTLMKLDL